LYRPKNLVRLSLKSFSLKYETSFFLQVLFHALKLPSTAGGEAGQVKLVKTITIPGEDWRV
jgi:hypothetical protein